MPHARGEMEHKGLAKFVVQSTDVLADMRINVFEEGTENVVWYKERFLGDEEIIEHIVENATSTILWTIHRPATRGWYIRIRASTFPPGVFINLTPPQKSSPFYMDAALTFACRTSGPPAYTPHNNPAASSSKRSLDSDVTLTDSQGHKDPVVHSYPPTPPQAMSPRLYPLSPRAAEFKVNQTSSSRRRSTQFVNGQITHFLLTPHSMPHVPQTTNASIFTRVVSALKNHTPSHSSSFTLSPLPPAVPPGHDDPDFSAPTPILTFHDRTPVWTVRSTHGLIELDTEQIRMLGVEMSFYVACALTYLEYLGERESYLAAVAD